MPPQVLLLISGKRASGKDFLCKEIGKHLRPILAVQKFSIGDVVKRTYAEQNGIKLSLFKNRKFKDEHREGLSRLSTQLTPGYCEQLILKKIRYCKDPIMMITDIRTQSNLEYFKSQFSPSLSIRISASDDVRTDVGWVYNPAIDDSFLECDLDKNENWDLAFHQYHLRYSIRKIEARDFIQAELYPKLMEILNCAIDPPWLNQEQ